MTKRLFILIAFLFFLCSCARFSRTHLMDSLSLDSLKNGVYIGEDKAILCAVKLKVTVKDKRIVNVEILNKFLSYPFALPAYKTIPQRIVEEQSVDVDALTMATVSSNSIKRAVWNALTQAKQKKGTDLFFLNLDDNN